MSLLVIDASVAAEWFLPSQAETLVEEGVKLLDRYAAGQDRFVVPDLFWPNSATSSGRRFVRAGVPAELPRRA